MSVAQDLRTLPDDLRDDPLSALLLGTAIALFSMAGLAGVFGGWGQFAVLSSFGLAYLYATDSRLEDEP